MKDWNPQRVVDLVEQADSTTDNAKAVGLLTEAHLIAPSNYEVTFRLASLMYRAQGQSCSGDVVRLAHLAAQCAPPDFFEQENLKEFFADIAYAHFNLRHKWTFTQRGLEYARASGHQAIIGEMENLATCLKWPMPIRFNKGPTALVDALEDLGCTFAPDGRVSISPDFMDMPTHLLIRSQQDLRNLDASKFEALAHVKGFVCYSGEVRQIFLEHFPFIDPDRVFSILYRPGIALPTAQEQKRRCAYVTYNGPTVLVERIRAGLRSHDIELAEELDSSCAAYVHCSDKMDHYDIDTLIEAQYLGAVPFCSAAPGVAPYVIGGRLFKLPYGREHIDAVVQSVKLAFDNYDAFLQEGKKLAEVSKTFFAKEKMGIQWLELFNFQLRN